MSGATRRNVVCLAMAGASVRDSGRALTTEGHVHRPGFRAAAIAIVLSIASVRAQPRRLPIIAGNGLVQVLVNVDGTVATWGDPHAMDPSINLGDGIRASATPEVKTPRLLPGISGVADVAVAISHALLLKRDGTVLAWGDNDACQLGNPVDKTVLAPIPVPGLKHVKQVAAAQGVSAAVLEDGTVWLWGLWGRECTRAPTKFAGIDHVTRVSIDGASVLALKDDGTVWGWGGNKAGGLCDGTRDRRDQPAPIAGIGRAVQAAIDGSSIIVLADGTVRMCGDNLDGALADPRGPRYHLTPFRVPGITTATSAITDGASSFVQLKDGTLLGWGNDYYGKLGDGRGDVVSAPRPHPPTGLGPVLAHYMSGNTSYAIRADGTVMNWCLPAPPGEKTEFILTPRAGFTVKLED